MIEKQLTNQTEFVSRENKKLRNYQGLHKQRKSESLNLLVREDDVNYLRALEILTPREIQILKRIVKAYTNKKIAAELFISERTVEKHRENISRKLNIMGYHAILKWYQRNAPTT